MYKGILSGNTTGGIGMSGTVLTNKGLALITKLVAASTELQISRVAVGPGRVPSGVDPQTMVDLNEYKMDAQIES